MNCGLLPSWPSTLSQVQGPDFEQSDVCITIWSPTMWLCYKNMRHPCGHTGIPFVTLEWKSVQGAQDFWKHYGEQMWLPSSHHHLTAQQTSNCRLIYDTAPIPATKFPTLGWMISFFFFFLSPHISCWGHFPAQVSIWVLPLSPRNPPLHLHLMSPMFRRAIRDKTTGRAADSKSGRDESERERPCDVQGNSRTRSKVPALGVWIESLE